MNISQLAIHIGKDKSYFAVMKTIAREKFDYIFSFDDDAYKSYKKYADFIYELKQDIEKIYFSFEMISLYGVWLKEKGISHIKNPNARAELSGRFFSIDKDPVSQQLPTIKQMVNIRDCYYSEFKIQCN